jgi:hypothetical protein
VWFECIQYLQVQKVPSSVYLLLALCFSLLWIAYRSIDFLIVFLNQHGITRNVFNTYCLCKFDLGYNGSDLRGLGFGLSPMPSIYVCIKLTTIVVVTSLNTFIHWLQVVVTFCTQMLKCSPMHIYGYWKDYQKKL